MVRIYFLTFLSSSVVLCAQSRKMVSTSSVVRYIEKDKLNIYCLAVLVTLLMLGYCSFCIKLLFYYYGESLIIYMSFFILNWCRNKFLNILSYEFRLW